MGVESKLAKFSAHGHNKLKSVFWRADCILELSVLCHTHMVFDWIRFLIIVGHRFLSSGWPSAIDSSQLVEAAHRFLSCGLLQSMAVTSLRMMESICFSFKSLWLLLSLNSKLLFQRVPQNGSSHSYSREWIWVNMKVGNSYFLRAPRKSQEATLGFFLPCDLYFLFLRDLCPFQKWWKLFQFLFFFPFLCYATRLAGS